MVHNLQLQLLANMHELLTACSVQSRQYSAHAQLHYVAPNFEPMICSASKPFSAIRSAQKLVFHRYLPIRCDYSTHRCLELQIWRFSCRRALALAHARRVISSHVAKIINGHENQSSRPCIYLLTARSQLMLMIVLYSASAEILTTINVQKFMTMHIKLAIPTNTKELLHCSLNINLQQFNWCVFIS